MCVETIKHNLAETYDETIEIIFDITEMAISILDKPFLKKSGVANALSAVWESDDVNELMQQDAGDILKNLL